MKRTRISPLKYIQGEGELKNLGEYVLPENQGDGSCG